MANVFTTISNMTNKQLKDVSDKKKEKEDKEKSKGSNIVEPTAAMIEKIRVRWVAGEDIKKIKFGVRNANKQKLSFEQVQEIILVLENVAVYNTDKNRYELQDEGRILIDTTRVYRG